MADFTNFAQLVGQYNSSLPTLSDGVSSNLQLDENGRLLIKGDIDVNLDHTAGDSVQVGDGTEIILVNTDGSINVYLTDSDGHSLDITASGEVQVVPGSGAVFTITPDGGSLTVDSELNTDDLDTGAGTDTQAIIGLALAESGGHVLVGSANPMPVSATDLDIRDLTHVSDSVAIGDGTDTLEIESDGSINTRLHDSAGTGLTSTLVGADQALDVNVVQTVASDAGTEADAVSDSANDGLIALTGSVDTLLTIAVPAGTTYHITGWQWACNEQADFRLEVYDDTTLTETIRRSLNSGAVPTGEMIFPTPIEITGGTNISIQVRARHVDGVAQGLAMGAVNGYTTT